MKKAVIKFIGLDEYGCRTVENYTCYAETTKEILQFVNEFYTERDEDKVLEKIKHLITYKVISIKQFDNSLWSFEYWQYK